MAEHQNFRTAFNGFNREDVVRYIEQLNARHNAEIGRLNGDLDHLRQKLAEAEAAIPEETAAPITITGCSDAAVKALEQQLTLAQAAAREAEEQLQEQIAENHRLQSLLDAALARQSEARNRQEAELDTYRRAERVEREARSRAGTIYTQVSDILTSANTRVEDTADQIAALADASMQQIKQLQLAISGSKQILRDTAITIGAIRPEGEEE